MDEATLESLQKEALKMQGGPALLIYADALEESGKMDLAYAFRWMQRKNKWPRYRPYSGRSRLAWRLQLKINERFAEAILPEIVFRSMSPNFRRSPYEILYDDSYVGSPYKKKMEAITALSKALKEIKKVME